MPYITEEEAARIARQSNGGGRIGSPSLPRRPRQTSIVGPVVTILAILVVYPLYGAAMIAMEAALFLDMPFRDTWDRVWVRAVLFVSFCWASLAVTMGIKALVKWVKD